MAWWNGTYKRYLLEREVERLRQQLASTESMLARQNRITHQQSIYIRKIVDILCKVRSSLQDELIGRVSEP